MPGAGLIGGLSRSGAAGWALVLLAPFFGSFVGVVIRRLPAARPLAWQRSRCDRCGAALTPRDLVPILSWLATGGRCRHCGEPIGWFYPGVEVGVLAIALVSVWLDGGTAAWLDFILGCWLLALAAIDLERWQLPDPLTLPLVLAGLAEAALFAPALLFDRALGAALGYFGLRAVALLDRRLRGREGLGAGDAKLFAAASAWVGAGGLPSVLVGAAALALLVAAALMLAGVRLGRHSALPFGPFLAAALWAVWLWGPLPL